MMKRRPLSKNDWLMFFIGLGSMTKVVLLGVMSISEVFIFALAPLIYFKHVGTFRKRGFLSFFAIVFLAALGCIASSIYHEVHPFIMMKAVAIYYSMFASACVFLVLLSKSPTSLKWFFLGSVFSTIISMYAFNPHISWEGTASFSVEQVGLEEAMESEMFLFPKLAALLRYPIIGYYLQCPMLYPFIAVPLFVVVTALTTISGRSASAVLILSLAIIAIGRKKARNMMIIGNHLITFSILLLILAITLKGAYSVAASSGALGDKAKIKYEQQTSKGSGLMALLISGRTEFFTTIRAVIDNPIIGIGPHALDTKGYYADFLRRYGSHEEEQRYFNWINRTGRVPVIPQHSYVTQFWGEAGIAGLLLILFFFKLVWQFFRKYAGSIPQWYGFFALFVPGAMWNLFFSPYTDRLLFPLLIVCLLIARAVGTNKLQLPISMIIEADRYNGSK